MDSTVIPICIAGMHRSGTSMVARMLNMCGLYLGEQNDLLQGAADNPEGFWENLRFFDTNEAILAALGGSWAQPPAMEPGWEASPALAACREDAQRAIDGMTGHGPWGWKDPRNSITLPFWQALIPGVKVIVCLRNPLDVAHSLAHRNSFSETFGLDLWLMYSQRLLDAVSSDNLLVTHYDAYFHDPRAELERVLEWAGMPAAGAVLDAACGSIKGTLRHTTESLSGLLAAGAPMELNRLYGAMCLQSGPVFEASQHRTGIREERDAGIQSELLRRVLDGDPVTEEFSAKFAEKAKIIEELRKPSDALEQSVQSLRAQVSENQAVIHSLSTELADQTLSVESLSGQLAEQTITVQALRTQVSAQNQIIDQYQALRDTLGVRLLMRYWTLGERLLPPGSRRRKLYGGSVGLLHALYEGGPKAFVSLLSRAVHALREGGVPLLVQRARQKLASRSSTDATALLRGEIAEDLEDPDFEDWEYKPIISVLVPVYNTPARYLQRMVASVGKQTYPHYELCICDDGSQDPDTLAELRKLEGSDARVKIHFSEANHGISAATNQAAKLASGDYLAFVDHDDELTPGALYGIAKAIHAAPDVQVLYSDQDKMDGEGRLSEPFYKPDWSPYYLESVMYVGHLLVVSRDLFESLDGLDTRFDGVQDYEFMLRVSERQPRVRHISRILYHWRMIPGSVALGVDEKGRIIEALQARAVSEHFVRLGVPAVASSHPKHRHRVIVQPDPRTEHPLVSLVIVTKDSPAYLRRCLKSIFERSTYPNYEVILVDNQTTDPEALLVMQSYRSRVVHFNEPFNFSKANNLGVQAAEGEIVVLLNNDTEVLTPGWIEALLFHLERKHVGAVGPMLIYSDGTVQHAGVVLGIRGTADHIMRHFPRESDGYAGSLSCPREVSALTAACIMLRRADYLGLGGLVEYYGTHYQDVDLSLQLRMRGKTLLFVPHAMLFHHESSSRGAFYDHLDRALLLDTWGDCIAQGDPYFNRHFSLDKGDYSLEGVSGA